MKPYAIINLKGGTTTETGTYKKGVQTRNKIVDVATRLFYENGCDRVSVTDICKNADIAPGNLTYYFKRKSDIICEILLRLLNQCKSWAKENAAETSSPLDFACLGSYIVMLTVCRDSQMGKFILSIYETLDSRFLFSIFVEEYYDFFVLSSHPTKLSDTQMHYLALADSHAKLGILRDLLQSTDFAPSLDEVLEMAEAAFLLTCRLCLIPDEQALLSIAHAKQIGEKNGFQGISIKDLLL